jgi:hypothetical protein
MTLPTNKLQSRTLPYRMLPYRTLPFRTLPFRALKLISEYSKPITRGDWRTFTRITMETYIKDKDKLFNLKNNRLYELVHRNMYEHLYKMNKEDLYWLVFHQFELIKYHSIIPIGDMTRLEMIYVEIQNEKIMKHPNYKQKNFFKNNQNLFKRYIKNNKLKSTRHRKYYSTKYFIDD